MKKQIPVKYLYNTNPFYVHFKKHYCPKCNSIMKRDYDSKIVNSNLPGAKNYDFAIGAEDSYYKGDVDFRTCFFLCPKCNKKMAFDEMKQIEKQLKNK